MMGKFSKSSAEIALIHDVGNRSINGFDLTIVSYFVRFLLIVNFSPHFSNYIKVEDTRDIFLLLV
jgi:hypothetical protein